MKGAAKPPFVAPRGPALPARGQAPGYRIAQFSSEITRPRQGFAGQEESGKTGFQYDSNWRHAQTIQYFNFVLPKNHAAIRKIGRCIFNTFGVILL